MSAHILNRHSADEFLLFEISSYTLTTFAFSFRMNKKEIYIERYILTLLTKYSE